MLVDFGTLALPDGTPLVAGAAGNAVAPDYFDSLATAPDGTATFHLATKTARLATVAGGGAAQFRKVVSAQQVVVEIEFHPMPLPTAGLRLIEIRGGSDTTTAGRVNLRPDGKVEFTDGTNTWRWQSSDPVPTGSGWRLYFALKRGTTTGNGEVHVAMYPTADGKAVTTDAGNRFDSTVQNVGTTDVAAIRAGFTSGGPGTLAVRNVQWGTQADMAEFGPVLAAPVLIGTRRFIQEFDYSASTGSAPLTLDVAQIAGPTLPTITVNGLVAEFSDDPARSEAAVLEFTLTNGAAASVSEEVVVLPIAGHASQDLLLVDGEWQ